MAATADILGILFERIFLVGISASGMILAVLVIRRILKRSPGWVFVLLWGLVGFRLICPFWLKSPYGLLPDHYTMGNAGEIAVVENYTADFHVSVKKDSVNETSTGEMFKADGSPADEGFSGETSADAFLTDGSMPEGENAEGKTRISEPDTQYPEEYRAGRQDLQKADFLKIELVISRFWSEFQRLSSFLALLWILGMAGMALVALVSYRRLKVELRGRLKKSESARGQGEIREYEQLKSPFIMGILCPAICIPTNMAPEKREYVLKHERTHINRRDHIWLPLGYGLLCVYWFSPFVWLAWHKFSEDLEIACDEKTTENFNLEEKKEYCRTLLECSISKPRLILCPPAFGEVGVKERIVRVLNGKHAAGKRKILYAGGVLIAGVAAVFFFMTVKTEETGKEQNVQAEAGSMEMQEGRGTEGAGNLQGGQKEPEDLQELQKEHGNDDAYKIEQIDQIKQIEQDTEEVQNQEELQERIIKEAGDLDGDGIKEYFSVTGSLPRDFPHSEHSEFRLYFDGKDIFAYQYPDVIADPALVEYLDLDDDGEKEIFLAVLPRVNSLPSMDFVVLKKENDEWHSLETTFHGDTPMGLGNAFPIHMICKPSRHSIVITCEGSEKEIIYDYGDRYQKAYVQYEKFERDQVPTGWLEYFKGMMDGTFYAENEEFGSIAPWGIWEIASGEYDGKNCLIATHGLFGYIDKYDYIGNLQVLFDYDQSGKIRILDLEFTQGYDIL